MICDQIVAFVDGELDPESAERFRGHLGDCPECQKTLGFLMQLAARLSEIGPVEPPEGWEDRATKRYERSKVGPLRRAWRWLTDWS
jgi:anti-sigma factor RsiW